MDCDEANKGWSYKGFAYAAKYGLMSKNDYHSSGEKSECHYNETEATHKNHGAHQEKHLSNEKLKKRVAKQPVTVGIVVTEQLRSYKSGVLTEEFLGCSHADKKIINHQVALIGYGKTDSKHVQSSWCREFWIALNSWGTSWGEQGLMKVCMDRAGESKTPFGTCQLNRFPSYPTLE